MVPLFLFAEDQAYMKYREGERASTSEDRKKAFNEALALYLQMESEHPSADLNFDIANCYYQLSEYGYAILYYNRALKENPRLKVAEDNLQIALQKAGIPYTPPHFFQSYLLFFHYRLSHNEKAITVLFMLFAAFTVLSVHSWVPNRVLKNLSYITLGLAILFTVSLLCADYFTPPEAVIIRPVALRRDAGEQYAPVLGMPLLTGSSVTVISQKGNGDWLKVRTNSGEEGYVSKEYARVV